MVKIKRALVSVSDKTGVVELGRVLQEYGVEILSTGGTFRALEEGGVKVRPVEDYTGFAEMMNGRVKTLHPKIHAGLLALRDNPDHMSQMDERGYGLIDMVVVNLYPFQQTVAKPNVDEAEAIENIDIGGPTMIRSGSKNFSHVAVVVNPHRYESIIAELRANDGALSMDTRRALACEAFKHTAEYDTAITKYLTEQQNG
ncbi:MAG: IMP cyclohydrolase [Candidatus Hydrogenedentes bacterium]|nr:IMP cyclohydrolase [Candidatus Hydrogenedentota bacterium]